MGKALRQAGLDQNCVRKNLKGSKACRPLNSFHPFKVLGARPSRPAQNKEGQLQLAARRPRSTPPAGGSPRGLVTLVTIVPSVQRTSQGFCGLALLLASKRTSTKSRRHFSFFLLGCSECCAKEGLKGSGFQARISVRSTFL